VLTDSKPATQLQLPLSSQSSASSNFFIRHSGVAEAAAMLELAVAELRQDPASAKIVHIWGPEGSGKSFLYEAIVLSAADVAEKLSRIRLPAAISEFVSSYEKTKSEGGLLFIESDSSPAPDEDPHIRSRLLNAIACEVNYPREEELPEIIRSILEQNGRRLSADSINYLIRHLRRDLLSFQSISGKIHDLSVGQGRPANLYVVREAVLAVNDRRPQR
jgi:chromosomal replication initiation ATPase DnaA